MCKMCMWTDLLDEIEEMQGNFELYGFAEDTLSGIADWIVKNEHVTPSQIEAVENIRSSRGR